MSIYELLERDHRSILEVSRRLLETEEKNGRERGLLIEQLRTEWIPHARAEEAVFYNSLRRVRAMSAWAANAYQTHIALESFLRLLQVQHKMGVQWRNSAETLRAGLARHFEKEENDLFPAAKAVFRREEAEMIGKAFERLKKEVRGGGLVQSSLELAANLMPPRLAPALRSYNLETRL